MRRNASLGARVAHLLALVIVVGGTANSAERRLAVPSPVLFVYGYADVLTGKPSFWPTSNQEEVYDTRRYKAIWEETIRVFNVIEGVTQDADFVKRLRKQGKIFAFHVSNNNGKKHNTIEDLASAWSEPFENTLAGQLPGGFDAICIDEFRSYPDGTKEAQLAIQALKQVREKYPDRLIFASGVYMLADGGPNSLSRDTQTTYDDTLNAIQKYADIFLLENYIRTGNPQFQYTPSMAKNIDSRSPGLLKKTIFILYIAQNGGGDLTAADDDPSVDFFNFLELQINLIKFGSLTKTMPGIGFWVFYRAKPETIEKVIKLTEEHYR